MIYKDYILKLIKNKWFWIVLVSIIVFFIVWKNWDRIKSKVTNVTGQVKGDFQPENITAFRKQQLEDLAQETYSLIYAATGSDVTPQLIAINALNDNELVYLAKHYKKHISLGNSLYKDIDDEIMPFTGIDEKLMARLSELKEM